MDFKYAQGYVLYVYCLFRYLFIVIFYNIFYEVKKVKIIVITNKS